MIAICGFFCGRGVLLMVPMGAIGPFWPGDSSSRAVGGGGACGLCPKSRVRRVRASPSKVYPDGKLQ